jgi:FtsP/CotA-like multicopper oxidase with cupredoxin domain
VEPITRRRALQLGGLGVAAVAVGAAGLARTAGAAFDLVEGAELAEPQVLNSTHGVLDLRLEAAETRVRLAGTEATAITYNGSLPGPTMHLQPGDRLWIEMDQMAGREGDLLLVNGQARPRLQARPGERERWRIVNACTSRYLQLRLDGQQMRLLGIDSGRGATPSDVDEVVLTTGNRADLLVTTAPGTAELRTLPYDRGGMGGMSGRGPGGGDGAG